MAEQSIAPAVLLELDGVDAGPVSTRPLLRDVSFTLSRGEIAVLLGGNGAGKTTLLRTASGLLAPLAGSIRGPRSQNFDARYSGLILEEPQSQFVSGSVGGEVEFALENLGWPGDRIHKRSGDLLARLELEHLADRDPRTLSAGEQGRCLMAAALGPGPRLLFLDDPFLHMEPGLSHRIWSGLREAVGNGEVGAVLLAAHDAELAVIADTVGILDEGRLAAWGPPQTVLRGPLPDTVEGPLGVWLEHRLREEGWELPGRDLDRAGLAERILEGLGR